MKNEDLIKLLDTRFEGVHTSIHNNREIFNLKLEEATKERDRIIEYNEKQNGELLAHTKEIEVLQKETSVWRTIQKHPLISVPVGLFLLGVIIAIVDLIGVVNIFK